MTHNRREAICAWLAANGINPNEMPTDGDLTIRTEPDGTRVIAYEGFDLDADGRMKLSERGYDAAISKRTTPLLVEPPGWWEPYEKPTRDQLLKDSERILEGLLTELHRRTVRCKTGPEMTEQQRINVSGELLGLRVALGIVLGHPATGTEGLRAAEDLYTAWRPGWDQP